MPSSSAVLEQITDILVRVVGCPADAVVPSAKFTDLGTDSLTIVEVGEELGRRFDIHLSDDAIDGFRSVNDAIRAVVRHEDVGNSVPRSQVSPDSAFDEPGKAWLSSSFLTRFAIVGVVVGAVLGLAGAAVFSATGIGGVELAPISVATNPLPTPSAGTTETPTPTPSATAPVELPDPTIQASSTRVTAGENFELSGAFPGSDAGEPLQVEVKDDGADWDDFPIEPVTNDGGTFTTDIYTSRTGTREFRVTNTQTNVSTPPVRIQIE